MDEPYEVHESSGNVFADLGLPDPGVCKAKSLILMAIEDAIHEQGLTQRPAAKRMGLTQPEVSNLLRGRMDGFSMDRLFRCLNALGVDVEIRLLPKPADRDQGEVCVDYVPTQPAEETPAEEQERRAA